MYSKHPMHASLNMRPPRPDWVPCRAQVSTPAIKEEVDNELNIIEDMAAYKGGAGGGGVGQRIQAVDDDVGNAVEDGQRRALPVPARMATDHSM